MEYLSPEQMAAAADDIVIAKVISSESRLSGDMKKIYTYVAVEVVEWIKDGGERPKTITIRQLGGSVGESTMVVAGDAHFVKGEETLLFLRKKSVKKNDGFYFLLGMAQSKYAIIEDSLLGFVVRRDLSKLALVKKDQHGLQPVIPAESGERLVKLDEMLLTIKKALSKTGVEAR
jgi:hypothetical protein